MEFCTSLRERALSASAGRYERTPFPITPHPLQTNMDAHRMKRPLLFLFALFAGSSPSITLAAIAFVASSVGGNGNGTSEALTMPTGYNTAGNVTVAVFIQAASAAGTSTMP